MIPEEVVTVAMSMPIELYEKIKKSGILEALTRGKHSRYEPFWKIRIHHVIPDNSIADKIVKATETLFDIDKSVEDMSNQMSNLEAVAHLNTALIAADLMVTIVGFAILNDKINGLSQTVADLASKIEKIDSKLENNIIQEYQEIALQFNNLTALVQGTGTLDIKDALEWLKKTQPFMNKLINNVAANAMNTGIALEMLFTLLPAYTAVTIMMMREYRFSTGKCFTGMNSYLALYKQLLDNTFTGEVAEYFFIDGQVYIRDVMKVVQAQSTLVKKNLEQVQDEMELLEVIETREEYKAFNDAMNESIRKTLYDNIQDIALKSGISKGECAEYIEKAFAVA